MKLPTKQSKWCHHSGAIYQVLLITNLKATKPDYPVTIVYQDQSGEIWSRPLSSWYESMREVV